MHKIYIQNNGASINKDKFIEYKEDKMLMNILIEEKVFIDNYCNRSRYSCRGLCMSVGENS